MSRVFLLEFLEIIMVNFYKRRISNSLFEIVAEWFMPQPFKLIYAGSSPVGLTN